MSFFRKREAETVTTSISTDLQNIARCPDSWFAAQLRPNMKLIAERNLARQGFETFNPERLETRRNRGRLRTEARQLFPGYVFVRFNPAEPGWEAINSTRGVTRLVTGPAAAPQALPRAFLAELFRRCDGTGLLHPDPSLKQGDAVRISHGPFSGILSRIAEMDTQERIHLLIQIMGREVRTAVPRSAVHKVTPAVPV
nr:transcription termination/antitermination NusG family protein [Ruegeria arenilitoris]